MSQPLPPARPRDFLTSRMLLAHLAAVLAVVAAGGLGVWQYGAWQTHRHNSAVDLTQRSPVPLTDVMGSNDAFPGRELGLPVVVTGTWLPQATVFVSGRSHEGREGYWAVTPITDGDGSAAAIPVVRGWTPTPADAPAPPSGTGTLVGWLQPSDADPTVVDQPTSADGAVVVPALQTAELAQRVRNDLFDAYLVDTDAGQVGALPVGVAERNDGRGSLAPADLDQLPQASAFTAIRNLLYALEWWFFGLFAVVVWWRYVRDERARSHGHDAGEPDDDDADRPVDTLTA